MCVSAWFPIERCHVRTRFSDQLRPGIIKVLQCRFHPFALHDSGRKQVDRIRQQDSFIQAMLQGVLIAIGSAVSCCIAVPTGSAAMIADSVLIAWLATPFFLCLCHSISPFLVARLHFLLLRSRFVWLKPPKGKFTKRKGRLRSSRGTLILFYIPLGLNEFLEFCEKKRGTAVWPRSPDTFCSPLGALPILVLL